MKNTRVERFETMDFDAGFMNIHQTIEGLKIEIYAGNSECMAFQELTVSARKGSPIVTDGGINPALWLNYKPATETLTINYEFHDGFGEGLGVRELCEVEVSHEAVNQIIDHKIKYLEGLKAKNK